MLPARTESLVIPSGVSFVIGGPFVLSYACIFSVPLSGKVSEDSMGFCMMSWASCTLTTIKGLIF